MPRGLPAGWTSSPAPGSRCWRVPCLLVVVAALAAGCGSDDSSKADFEKAAASATGETSQIGTDIGEAVTNARTKTDAELDTMFSGLTTRVREIIADLKALDPPDEAREKVDGLASALDAGAEDLDAIATAASSSEPEPARAAAQKLAKDSPAIAEANRALKAELGSDSE